MQIRWARNQRLKDVEVIWDRPASEKWQSALRLDEAKDVELDGFRGRSASAGASAVVFTNVEFQRGHRHGQRRQSCRPHYTIGLMARSDWYSDTDPRAVEVCMLYLNTMVFEMARAAVPRQYPEADEREVFLRTAARHLDRETMRRVYGWDAA